MRLSFALIEIKKILHKKEPDWMMSIAPSYTSILDMIGNTPLVELTHLDTGLCRLFLKLENQNPGGSIKDRIAVSMIEEAEKRGLLKPNGTIIEATAGNTGIGLALVGKMKGYHTVLVIPDKMSQEKINHLKALGTQIVMTRSDVGKGHPDYYQDMALRIAREKGYYFVNQFENEANPLAHETTTGPEIWQQMKGKVDAVVVGVGSSGTITGLSRYFAKVSPQTAMVLADPVGSILAEYVNTGILSKEVGSWLVEGIGEDFIPPIADLSRTKKAYSISDQESFDNVRLLLQKEGILGGSSTGTLLSAALRYCKEQTSPQQVVTFVCDTGNKYLSKMYNDFWLLDKGLRQRKVYQDLRDLIARRYEEGDLISVGPEDTLAMAYAKIKLYQISQLPVLDKSKLVGILDETDILLADNMQEKVEKAMSKNLVTVKPSESVDSLLPILKNGMVVIVEDDHEHFYGIITKTDLIHYWQQHGR
jgi:cystathionine beta-synthase